MGINYINNDLGNIQGSYINSERFLVRTKKNGAELSEDNYKLKNGSIYTSDGKMILMK